MKRVLLFGMLLIVPYIAASQDVAFYDTGSGDKRYLIVKRQLAHASGERTISDILIITCNSMSITNIGDEVAVSLHHASVATLGVGRTGLQVDNKFRMMMQVGCFNMSFDRNDGVLLWGDKIYARDLLRLPAFRGEPKGQASEARRVRSPQATNEITR